MTPKQDEIQEDTTSMEEKLDDIEDLTRYEIEEDPLDDVEREIKLSIGWPII